MHICLIYFLKRGEKMKKFISFILTFILIISSFAVSGFAATTSSKAGIVSVTSGKLNVRNSASTTSAVIGSLSKGSYVTLMSKSGNWWRVEYNDGKYGYCHADYIKTVTGTPATVNISSGSLNVRSGAGTSYSKIASLYKGEIVIVLSTTNNWSKILFNGTKTGYVSSQYLSSNNYSKISLNVPSFKQTDSRWANVKIGTSGKTIAQIGCATTAIAMMESYRTGTTIYPDAMSKRLSYSSSGNVYWPSNYTVVTNSSNYLNGIYNQLKNGKPVRFGAKKASGSQHWVVITGYNGGNTLTASGFVINDPGSKSRTTLQALLNEYPTFYKYFYY
jgi:uncharacterized protein YgiM (DUF1202 family)